LKIGLIDVDGHHYPNLALMKISAWPGAGWARPGTGTEGLFEWSR